MEDGEACLSLTATWSTASLQGLFAWGAMRMKCSGNAHQGVPALLGVCRPAARCAALGSEMLLVALPSPVGTALLGGSMWGNQEGLRQWALVLGRGEWLGCWVLCSGLWLCSSYLGHHSPVGTGVLLPVWCVAQQVPGTSDGAHKEAFLWLTAGEC